MLKLRTIILICLVLFLISFGIYTTWRTHENSTDFDTYYFAAKDALSGSSVYSEHQYVSPYIYPPFFACLITPLTFFSLEAASVVWYAINIGLGFLSLFLCSRLIFGREKISDVFGQIPMIPKTLFLIVAGALLLDNLSMLQVNITTLFLTLLGIYFFRRKMDIWAGLFLAMAISIKIIPVLFFIYFAIKREFRTCMFIILWSLVFSLLVPSFYLGWGGTLRDLANWGNDMFINSVSAKLNHDTTVSMFNPENQSLAAFFSRWLVKNDFFIIHLKRMAHEYPVFLINRTLSLTNKSALNLSKVFVFLLMVSTFFYCRKRIEDRESKVLNFEYALIFSVSLIANPILKTQQMIFLIFPAILILFLITKSDKDYRFFYAAFVLSALLYLSQISRTFKVIGCGTLSILCFWGTLLVGYHKALVSGKTQKN